MFAGHFLSWIETAPVDKRVEAAAALGRAYGEFAGNPDDLDTAETAATLLADDPDPAVRQALAEAFAAEPLAPRHVVMSLAGDLPEIAALVLACSPVFMDGELADFAAGGAPEIRIAVACRAHVSSALASAIAGCGDRDACEALLANPGAEVPATALHEIAERHGDHAAIRRLLLTHDALAPRTRLLLIEKLGELIEARSAGTSSVSPSRIGAMTRDTCDKAIVAYAARVSESELGEIVEALIAEGRMTTVILLRAICMGNIAFFAQAVATLAGVPVARVEAALNDGRRNVFRALYRKADLPEIAFDVFARAVDSWRLLLSASEPFDAARMSYLVTREVLANYRSHDDPQVDRLLVLLRRLAADAARENARREAARLADALREPSALPAPEAAAPLLPEPIDLPDEVVAAFAAYLAEEIVDLEAELQPPAVLAPEAPATEIEEITIDLEAVAEAIANDDAPPAADLGLKVAAPGSSLRFEPGEPVESVIAKVRGHMRARMAA